MSLKPLALAAALAALASAASADPVAEGAHLARIMDCAGCHMPRDQNGVPIAEAGLSGGTVGFELPGLGIFWPPNLTSSADGLGTWSDTEIADAIRNGTRPDGRTLAPVMPYMSYAELTDNETAALIAYLRSLPPKDGPRLEPVADAKDAKAPFFRVTMP
ncbi:c-type cytochrome [Seohaeicola nanhaiensis]|uniref:C-type cytochrome n=1 Tax=Seohaeicola nanhaiensis TaxID=1387282 RepID=A0ABV9KKJ0_9RHOB